MRLAKATSHLVGRPYRLGEMDCFMVMVKFLQEEGLWPGVDEYRGWTLETYKELFESDPARAKELMVAFMDEYFESIAPVKAGPGTVLLVKPRGADHWPFLAINGGNGNIIFATEEKGVVAMNLKYYKILRAWRCREQ